MNPYNNELPPYNPINAFAPPPSYRTPTVNSTNRAETWSTICNEIVARLWRYARSVEVLRINRHWNAMVKPYIYSNPHFGGRKYSKLKSFTIFLDSLSHLQHPAVAKTTPFNSLVTVLDLSQITESLYDTIPTSWLNLVLKDCPNLQKLDSSNATFLTDEAVMQVTVKQHHLSILIARNCTQVSSNWAERLLSIFGSLTSLDASFSSTIVTDSSCGILSSHVEELILNEATSLTDRGLQDLGRRSGTMKSLRLEACIRISDSGLSCLRGLPLETVNIKNCTLITATGLYHLVSGVASTLRILDISGCRGIQFTPNELRAVTSNLGLLRRLVVSYYHLIPKRAVSASSPSSASSSSSPPVTVTEKDDFLQAFAECTSLTDLTVDEVSEEGTNRVLINLCSILTYLRQLTLIRKSYESDFMLGMYSELSKDSYRIDAAWVKQFNADFAERGLVSQLRTASTYILTE